MWFKFINLSPPIGVVYTKSMLHYFDSKLNADSFRDIITGISGSALKRADFIGYNVVDHATTQEMIREENGFCIFILRKIKFSN